jgi:hypothetical protein
VIRQLLTESALLSLLAGMFAQLFTWALLRVTVTLATAALPAAAGTLVFDVSPDLAIFAYVFAVSVFAGILFGLAPALESSRSALYSGVRGGTSAVRSRRIQDLLIAAQVALSLALLIAGSTLTRGAIRSLKTDTGYDNKQVVDVDLQFPESAKYTADRKLALVRELRRRLAALPGVAAITSAKPPDSQGFRTAAVSLDGEKSRTQGLQSIVHYAYVEANYFETLRIPLVLGRGFPAHAEAAGNSVILSESAA